MSAHVVAFDKGIEGTAFRCEHCTLTYSPPMPMPLAKYVEQAKGFSLMHRGCEKPVKPSKQVELFNGLGEGPARLGNAYVGFPGYKGPPTEDTADTEPPEIDPETDPPQRLLDPVELRHLVTCVRPRKCWPSVEEVESWHTDVRAAVQRWCHIEQACASGIPIAGHPLPERLPMPNVLFNLGLPAPKNQRGARPLSSAPEKTPARKAKAATAPNGSSA